MGINFHVKDYECKARWSYTGFFRFRQRIAKSLGLKLEIDSEFKWIDQDWESWDKDWLIFLTHSDCNGYFTSYRCGRISRKLKIVLDTWEPKDIIESYDLEHGIQLVKAMKHCKNSKKIMRIS